MLRHLGIIGGLSFLTSFVFVPSAVYAQTPPPAISDLSVKGPAGSVAAGSTATFTASAHGNGGTPWYQFWVQTASGWRMAQNFSAVSTFQLTSLAPGSYIVVVDALDENQVASGQWSQALSQTFVLNVGSAVSLNAPSTATAGKPVTLTAQASNLIQPVYQWWWQNPAGIWHASGNYQSSPQFSWTPHMSGTYRVLVYAKDPLAPNNATDAVWSATSTVTIPPVSLAYGYFSLAGNTPGHAWYDLTTHPGAFTTVAPLWYTIDPTGSDPLTATMDANTMSTVTTWAAGHGVGVWPTVSFDGTVTDSWWTSSASQQLIQDLVSTASRQGYQGYVLDWESIPAAQRDAFTAFVRQLGQALQQTGLVLTVAVLPPPNASYDYAALAQAANYVDLLAYPEYTTASPSTLAPNPGPTAGYPWVKHALANALASIPQGRLLLGISSYGQTWTYTNNGFQGGQAIPNRTISQNLVNQAGQFVWDPVQHELEITTGPLATAPSPVLSPDAQTFNPAVQNLQSLLNTVLLRYAVAHGLSVPPLLQTDGGYGPATEAAVARFQDEFSVNPTTPGIYGPKTEAALQSVIDSENIGSTVAWDENTQASMDLLGLALNNHLGGMSLWRLGYQSPAFWPQFSALWPSK